MRSWRESGVSRGLPSSEHLSIILNDCTQNLDKENEELEALNISCQQGCNDPSARVKAFVTVDVGGRTFSCMLLRDLLEGV